MAESRKQRRLAKERKDKSDITAADSIAASQKDKNKADSYNRDQRLAIWHRILNAQSEGDNQKVTRIKEKYGLHNSDLNKWTQEFSSPEKHSRAKSTLTIAGAILSDIGAFLIGAVTVVPATVWATAFIFCLAVHIPFAITAPPIWIFAITVPPVLILAGIIAVLFKGGVGRFHKLFEKRKHADFYRDLREFDEEEDKTNFQQQSPEADKSEENTSEIDPVDEVNQRLENLEQQNEEMLKLLRSVVRRDIVKEGRGKLRNKGQHSDSGSAQDFNLDSILNSDLSLDQPLAGIALGSQSQMRAVKSTRGASRAKTSTKSHWKDKSRSTLGFFPDCDTDNENHSPQRERTGRTEKTYRPPPGAGTTPLKAEIHSRMSSAGS